MNVRAEFRLRDLLMSVSLPDLKPGPFPIMTTRADGVCSVYTDFSEPAGARRPVEYVTRLVWQFYEPADNLLRPYDPDHPVLRFDPSTMTAFSSSEARAQHAYMVACVDQGLLESFLEQEAGRQGPIAHSLYWDLPGAPVLSPGGGMLCRSCRARIEAWTEARYCWACGACV